MPYVKHNPIAWLVLNPEESSYIGAHVDGADAARHAIDIGGSLCLTYSKDALNAVRLRGAKDGAVTALICYSAVLIVLWFFRHHV